MRSQFGAKPAVDSTGGRLFNFRNGFVAMAFAAALGLGGCMPASVPLAGADPADPSVRVAGVAYRSTVAPFTRLRPTAPTAWRQQNENVTPSQKPNE